MKYHNYLVCPMCGKRSLFRNFFGGLIHKLRVYVNEFGGRGHCVWSEKTLNFEEEKRLREEMQFLIKRLAADFGVVLKDVYVYPSRAHVHSRVPIGSYVKSVVPVLSSKSSVAPYSVIKVPVKVRVGGD